MERAANSQVTVVGWMEENPGKRGAIELMIVAKGSRRWSLE